MKNVMIAAIMGTLALSAADYTGYSAEELIAMRGSVPAEDRADFRKALKAALSDLSAEERRALMSKNGQGNQAQKRKRNRRNAE